MTVENILLSLVRAALWECEPSTESFPLDEEQWNLLRFMARKQTVQGIVYDAICQLPEDLLPPDDMLVDWMQEVQAIEASQQRQTRALAWLTTRIEAESSLRPIVLKGLPLATLYPIPSHRISGDIDLFYGSTAAAEAADRLVESWGTKITKGEQGESIFSISQVPVEHHAYLVLSHVPWRKRRLTSWIERKLAEEASIREVTVADMPVHVLSPELDMVQLGSHNLKHALNEGIGLRQLCDLALFVSHHHESLRSSGLRNLLSRFGLRRWTDLCLAYCTTYLGLSSDKLPYSVNVSGDTLLAMHREVLESGNFGQMDDRYTRGEEGHQSATAQRITHNVWRYFRLSPMESLCWYISLLALRVKEKLFTK